jgi:hypothetical protein
MWRPVRVRDRCGDVERRLGRHLPVQFKDMDGRKGPAMTIEEFVSIASRWGKQRKPGSCGRRVAPLGHRHDAPDRFARCTASAPDRGACCGFGGLRPALDRAGFFRTDALQRRGENLYRRLQKEPRPVVDIDLPDRLRATPVGVHEVWLLGQWPAKILRAPQAIKRPFPRRPGSRL